MILMDNILNTMGKAQLYDSDNFIHIEITNVNDVNIINKTFEIHFCPNFYHI